MSAAPPGAAHSNRGARAIALAAVVRCLRGSYLSRALTDEFERASPSGQDRSLATDLAYGTVRRLSSLDAQLAPYLADPGQLPAEVLAALRIGAYELLRRGTPAYAAVSAWVDVAKGVSGRYAKLVNAVLRQVARSAASTTEDGREPTADEAVGQAPAAGTLDPVGDLALPAWLFERFSEALGVEMATRAALEMLEPEPLWLTAFGPEAPASLLDQGCEVRPAPRLPLPVDVPDPDWPASLSVRSPVPLSELVAFRRGLVQPQNPTSLYAARLVGAVPGALVYDLAAGHGVKTATLASSGARVVAVELSEKREQVARRNLRRLGLVAEHLVADLTGGWPGADVRPGDRVLLDAPCSGTGTLRGNPEIKLRLTSDDVRRLADVQSAMLTNAAKVVRPGGQLVYAVCALTPEEGVRQVERFLAENQEFEELPGVGVVSESSGSSAPFATPDGPGTYIVPSGGLDGFYLARLKRAD